MRFGKRLLSPPGIGENPRLQGNLRFAKPKGRTHSLSLGRIETGEGRGEGKTSTSTSL